MVAWLLFQKIAQLFIILAGGFLLVKLKLAKSSDSRYLSLVLLYLVNPCVLITSFQLEISPERLRAMLFSLCAGILAHVVMLLLNMLLRKFLKLKPVEQISCIYTNCMNLLIPIVGSILGKEWIPFTSMYMIIQVSLMWTHGRILISGETKISLKKIFGNLNIICIFIGLALGLMQIPPVSAGGRHGIRLQYAGPHQHGHHRYADRRCRSEKDHSYARRLESSIPAAAGLSRHRSADLQIHRRCRSGA